MFGILSIDMSQRQHHVVPSHQRTSKPDADRHDSRKFFRITLNLGAFDDHVKEQEGEIT
jgi:hypothetical protein